MSLIDKAKAFIQRLKDSKKNARSFAQDKGRHSADSSSTPQQDNLNAPRTPGSPGSARHR